MDSKIAYSIAEVERETGIGRDTLRIWERRYGFPTPERNQRDERVYSSQQLERLRLLKQLLDKGMQPGKLIRLDDHQLKALASVQVCGTKISAAVEVLLNMLISGPQLSFKNELEKLLHQFGLKHFLTEFVAPMNHAVGEAWFSGKIGILEEHRYAEIIRIILTNSANSLPAGSMTPRVLLTTFPGEQHGIGLLMVACVLRLEGADVISIGTQTPLEEIARGAVESCADIVGLSCSEYISRRTTASQMVQLRKLLPGHIQLWAGGRGVNQIGVELADIRFFSDLDQLSLAVQNMKNVSK